MKTKTQEAAQVVTVDTIIAEFRTLLNARFLDLKRQRDMIGGTIADPKFYAKLIREFIGDRKLTARYQKQSERHSLVMRAIKHAEYICHTPGRRENAAMYSQNFRKCGLC